MNSNQYINIVHISEITSWLAYVHKIHLFILQYISSLLLKVIKICKLHEIAYEQCVYFTILLMITCKVITPVKILYM